jgi:hypothetical protein
MFIEYMNRSLHYASLREAPVGMTVGQIPRSLNTALAVLKASRLAGMPQ